MPAGDMKSGTATAGLTLPVAGAAEREARERVQVLTLTLLADALALLLAFSLVTVTRLHTLIYLDSLWELHRDQVLLTGVYLLAILIAGGYSPPRVLDRFDAAYYPLVAIAITGAIALGVWMLLPDSWPAMSRRELVLGTGLSMVFLAGWRYFLGGLTSEFASLHRYFTVVGEGDAATRITEEIRNGIGRRSDAQQVSVAALRQAAAEAGALAEVRYSNRDAIIMLTQHDRAELSQVLEICETRFSRTFIYPTLHDTLFFPHSNLLAVGGVPLIEVSTRHLFTPYIVFKRAIDIAVASMGILLAAPIILATAIAMKITSPGPLLYSQERMGLHGRRFQLYKFRSMVVDAEANTGPVWARSNDSRVTPLGKILRKHRIDEIPQLFNVLKGDMSLIGPRPERPHFHAEFCKTWPLFERRLAVRPGVTSLSHVLGSYESDPQDRLRYDLIYINNLSLLMDARILVATVRVVLGAKGAQ